MSVPAVAYLRVSTEEQDVANQKLFLEKWASERGLTIVAWYVDEAVSGAMDPFERPGFRKLINDVESGRVRANVLLVYELSRLVRNFADLFRVLDYVEGRLGLVVVSASPSESILQNVDGAFRQFLRAVLGFIAHMEREFIRQRVRAALERARREGRISNVLDRVPQDARQLIVEEWRSGVPLREIARKWGLSLYEVRRVLAAEAGYRPSRTTCPRCFARMRVVERSAKLVDGRYVVETRLRCDNCGYEENQAG